MQIESLYDYRDENAQLVFQVVRLRPKGFRQGRPDGKGAWLWNVGNTRKVPFHLPELVAAPPEDIVFVVEGEKDVLVLERLGLVATTNAGGAGKWRDEFSEFLWDRQVAVLPDHDDPGRDHAVRVARSLHGVAASVTVVPLPGLEPGGDVSDWIQAGGTRGSLLELVERAAPWIPQGASASSDVSKANAELPVLIVTGRTLPDLTAQSLAALIARNDPPSIFERSGQLVRIRYDECARPLIEELKEDLLRNEMARAASFMAITRAGMVPKPPPMDVVRDVRAERAWGFPPLEAIVQAPCLRPDGTVLTEPGYDPATRLFHRPQDGITVAPIPKEFTRDHIDVAMTVVSDVLHDFPFVDEASRANAIGLMLTPILRPAIPDPVPMALIDAPEKGTGKTHLAKTVGLIATGKAEVMGAPRREEEFQKLITSVLLGGTTFVILDNLRGTLRSASLERTLTATHLKDRVLGASRMIDLPQRATWVGTANNVDLSGDLSRRCYWIRLDAKKSRPWEGRTFRYPDLLKTVREQRSDLLWALLVLSRSWYAAGCPESGLRPLGGFEAWSRTVGGVLAHVGVEGFLANLEEMYEQMDTSAGQWEAFLRAILHKLGSTVWSVSTLVGEMVSETEGGIGGNETGNLHKLLPDELVDAFAAIGSARSRSGFSRKLGISLRHQKDKRYGEDGMRLVGVEKESRSGAVQWRVLTDA